MEAIIGNNVNFQLEVVSYPLPLSLLQCIGEVMTARYTKFPKKNCPAVSSPCWIPQADSIINEQIIRGLPQCDTIEKYGCMLHTLRQAVYRNVEKQCMKSCKAESYNIITSDGTTNPWTTVRSVINTLKLFLN